MKAPFSTLTLALSWGFVFTAQAADRKLGNMIAVERTIPHIYQSCVDQATSEKNPINLYSCKFEATNNKMELAPGTHRFLTLDTEDCTVEATLKNSIILVMFRSQSSGGSFSSAKSCLRQAIDSSTDKDNFKYIVYTLEP